MKRVAAAIIALTMPFMAMPMANAYAPGNVPSKCSTWISGKTAYGKCAQGIGGYKVKANCKPVLSRKSKSVRVGQVASVGCPFGVKSAQIVDKYATA
ncbi:hypothetical protein [Corynebacterium camporealensis]|uniref:Uncharacterized protein n=1 Tax=Corynebacterium camporealensis TaxID=161896 RepID=A0A0F6QUI6_9CORY|nr:hypothetical protein [Corynebacterium camporealensis]AKE38262.1 hypothetical protein UL81_01385 [Corynebacterium camporealensis]